MEDEAHLIQRSQQDDLAAFNVLVERYQGQVYNLALRMLGDHALADDAAQQTFISAHRGIGGFRGGNFRAWLMRITANSCRDMMRAAKSRQALSLEALELTQASIPQSKEESPEDHALRTELGREIQASLAALSQDQRLVLTLVDIQGYSYDEVAQIVRTSVGTVKSRLSRARGNMRDLLRQHSELLPSQFRLEQ